MPPAFLGATGVLDYDTVPSARRTDFRLNVEGAPADTPSMGPDRDESTVGGGSGDVGTDRDITARSRRQLGTRVDAEAEMERLQEKVSLLAVQKDFWQQRAAEYRVELRTAEAEVARLREAVGAPANLVLIAE